MHTEQHNSQCHLLRSECARAHLEPAVGEPVGLLAALGRANDRPADVFLPRFSGGRDLCLDVTLVSSFTNMTQASVQSGYNAERAEKRKRDTYQRALVMAGYAFAPFAMESLGGFGPACKPVIAKIGQALADVDGITPGLAAARLRKKLQFRWMSSLGRLIAAHVRRPDPDIALG